jgi:hypothetical protein
VRTPIPGFTPETDLERRLARDPVLQEGWAWGEPRRGHPEGSVGAHVADLLRAIEARQEDPGRRAELRFLSLLHDSLKFQVDDSRPRTGPNHHAARARAVAEKFTDDQRLLATIQDHDRPYQLWRKLRRRGEADDDGFDAMLARIPDLPLFVSFVELDSSTEGKNPEPLEWFRDELRRRGKID